MHFWQAGLSAAAEAALMHVVYVSVQACSSDCEHVFALLPHATCVLVTPNTDASASATTGSERMSDLTFIPTD